MITLPKAGAIQESSTTLTSRGFAGILCEISPRDIGLGQSGLGGHYINVICVLMNFCSKQVNNEQNMYVVSGSNFKRMWNCKISAIGKQ
ncbi:hypothetical protein [Microbulbifer rhizosphaerae]|uniref:Uncharacterized protein n=1 Tax=Microbulbifer rhizosphaerae TaxID=1562603 RepID=A0A7W4WFH7_9GAMM|nr:hypothetical protein [Microbulbifer rhizosphaerae]MBB3063256.1 hypothetical protein [Microbulbifer rhizosphaerae]